MANLAQENQLYEETFKINGINAEKYDRVSRLSCVSTDGATEMELDINHELFPCQNGETLHVVLATSLSLDGSKDDEKGWRDVAKAGGGEATLADMFEYVCHGKVYKFEDDAKVQDQMWVPV
jgi:DNA-directed RNA polymerase I, II, and III subunit RPABC3